MTRLLATLLLTASATAADPLPVAPPPRPVVPLPAAHTTHVIEGWNVRVDDRLKLPGNDDLRRTSLRFLENKLADIIIVMPPDRLAKLRKVTIQLDLDYGQIGPMQYHPSAGWLKNNGYATNLAKCVHLPRAADLATKRNVSDMPWVILHELAHAYHDQVLGFDNPRVREAFEAYRASGRGEKALLYDGRRVKHYALTNPMEFFAEMTEAYFGVNDFFPFTRAELKESEPAIYELMADVWTRPLPAGGR
ncbi:M90 metallopeptidase family protein [Urbifossiella limnaea]|uniref:Metallopeptidase n=1 Tax=Urbifossiella limnaea TaxID=2528023 RepID=A0A517XXX2_9BACT|nr:zinc-dependent peptidase [Urbifossiella limnaea]QDU22362.1 hypothetical protein ETAA1_43400 [Urbifossiella limnaea]